MRNDCPPPASEPAALRSDTGTAERPEAPQQRTLVREMAFEANTVAPVGGLPYTAITHTCGAWWTGVSRSHCPAEGCHRTFSCDSAAELHRVGKFGVDRRCVDPATVGLVAKDMPFGVMWQHPAPEAGRDTRRHIDTEETTR